jgi:hypothetical protein
LVLDAGFEVGDVILGDLVGEEKMENSKDLFLFDVSLLFKKPDGF